METGSDSGQRPRARGGGGGKKPRGEARRGSAPRGGKAWRRQVGRTSSAPARERASERGRAREGPEGGGKDGSALSKYKSRREAGEPGAEPQSRRAGTVPRPHGGEAAPPRREAEGERPASRAREARGGAGRRERRSPRGGRRRRAGLEGAARPRVREPRQPRAPAARRGATRHGDGREPPSPPVLPSLPPWLARSLARSREQHGCGRRLRLPGRAE